MYSLNLGVILCARSGAEHQPHLVHSPRISAALLNRWHPFRERALVKVQYSFRGSLDQDSGIDEFLFSDLDFVQLLTCKTRCPQHLHTNKWAFNSQRLPLLVQQTEQSNLTSITISCELLKSLREKTTRTNRKQGEGRSRNSFHAQFYSANLVHQLCVGEGTGRRERDDS